MNIAEFVSVSKDQTSTVLDNETVIVNLQAGTYYSLDATGSRVWQLIQAPISIADVCAMLEQEFQVEPSQCRKDILELMDNLAEEGLIQTHRQ